MSDTPKYYWCIAHYKRRGAVLHIREFGTTNDWVCIEGYTKVQWGNANIPKHPHYDPLPKGKICPKCLRVLASQGNFLAACRVAMEDPQ